MLVADLRKNHEVNKIETRSPSKLGATITVTLSPLFAGSETCEVYVLYDSDERETALSRPFTNATQDRLTWLV